MLCRLEEVPDGGARSFALLRDAGAPVSVILVRRPPEVRAYVNRCPHRGTPLDWRPDEFFDATGEHLVCATHGALFRVGDGRCIAGPCAGDALTSLAVELRDGDVIVRAPD